MDFTFIDVGVKTQASHPPKIAMYATETLLANHVLRGWPIVTLIRPVTHAPRNTMPRCLNRSTFVRQPAIQNPRAPKRIMTVAPTYGLCLIAVGAKGMTNPPVKVRRNMILISLSRVRQGNVTGL